MLFDLAWCSVSCVLTSWLISYFLADYWYHEYTFFLFPFAIIPYTYCCSLLFDKESTAQIFTIYQHVVMSGIAGMIVFALRMVAPTA